MLIVDLWHWLDEKGDIPTGNPRLRRNVVQVLRVVEYGSPLEPEGETETLIECRRRPGGRRCPGLLRVRKEGDNSLLAFCPACDTDEMLVSNWEETRWGRPRSRPN
jgi:hypothetical protein